MQNYSTTTIGSPLYKYSCEEWSAGDRQWHANWVNFISNYTTAMLQAGVLQEVRDIDIKQLKNASQHFEKAHNSSMTLFLSLARTITNLASKVFKAVALTFGTIAIINTFILPITLPQVMISNFAAIQFFIIGSIFQLATKGLDKLKNQWVNSYFTSEEREEIDNFRKFKQIQNLDKIHTALSNVDTAYNHLLHTYGVEAIHKGRMEWNNITMGTHLAFLRKIKCYQEISNDLQVMKNF